MYMCVTVHHRDWASDSSMFCSVDTDGWSWWRRSGDESWIQTRYTAPPPPVLPDPPSPILHQHVERLQPDSALPPPPPPPPSLSFIHDRAQRDDKDERRGKAGRRGCFCALRQTWYLLTVDIETLCLPTAVSKPEKTQRLHTYEVVSWQQQQRELTLLLYAANHGPPQPPPLLIGWACQQ